MSKKFVLIFAAIFLFSISTKAFASVLINEVEISPTEGRFIELFNSGSSTVSLQNWYIQRKTSTGTFGSLVTKTDFGNSTIAPNSYFLISRSQMANSNLVLADLTLTESNTIQIKDADGNVTDKIGWGSCGESFCTSNPSDGKSIQRDNSGNWLVATPTPGRANNMSADGQNNTNNGGGGTGLVYNFSPDNSTSTNKTVENPKIVTKILAEKTAFVGMPWEFKAETLGYSGESVSYGRYFWNFGDGDSKEIKASENTKYSHVFPYAGKYNVALEYFQNYYSEVPDAVDKIILEVVPADVSISSVGDEKDFFVEVSNGASYDVDISKWILSGKEKNFIFPQNTILDPKGKIILSPNITGFTISDKENLKLLDSSWKTVFDYSSVGGKLRAKSTVSANTIKKDSSLSSSSDIPVQDSSVSYFGNTEDSTAENPLEANAGGGAPGIMGNLKYEIFGLFLLGIGASAAYYVRTKGKILAPKISGDDFEIIDE